MKYYTPAMNNCLQTNGEDGLPYFQGYVGNRARPERRITHQHQAIIPSYKFTCCGNITEWGVDLSPAQENGTFDFDFQVWRPSPTVNETGCYSLVGNLIATSLSLPDQPESDHVARITPLPLDYLQFQPGDVLGFYVESHDTSSDRDNGVVLLSNGSHANELVWYASIDTSVRTSQFQSGSCPYPIGVHGVLDSLTRAAPVISLSLATYCCSHTTPQLKPTVVSQSSGDRIQVSNTLLVGVAVPLLALFGIVNAITVIVVIVLYCKVRKLRSAVDSMSINNQYPPNKESQREEIYDLPSMRSTHTNLIRNVAYDSPYYYVETEELQENSSNHPINRI